jgi:hypothetical protein
MVVIHPLIGLPVATQNQRAHWVISQSCWTSRDLNITEKNTLKRIECHFRIILDDEKLIKVKLREIITVTTFCKYKFFLTYHFSVDINLLSRIRALMFRRCQSTQMSQLSSHREEQTIFNWVCFQCPLSKKHFRLRVARKNESPPITWRFALVGLCFYLYSQLFLLN